MSESIREQAIENRKDEYLTVAEFATLVREHPHSVYRRIREGRQPGVVRFGRDIRIDIVAAAVNCSKVFNANPSADTAH